MPLACVVSVLSTSAKQEHAFYLSVLTYYITYYTWFPLAFESPFSNFFYAAVSPLHPSSPNQTAIP